MLTLQFVPYAEIEHLGSDARVGHLLNIVKQDKIVLMQGRLNPDDEIKLIQHTMEQIQDRFRGIELCTIFPEEKDIQFLGRLRKGMVKALIGNRDGITVIGPSNVVKEIKRDPKRLQLFTITPRLTMARRRPATRRSSSRRSRRTSRTSRSRRTSSRRR